MQGFEPFGRHKSATDYVDNLINNLIHDILSYPSNQIYNGYTMEDTDLKVLLYYKIGSFSIGINWV